MSLVDFVGKVWLHADATTDDMKQEPGSFSLSSGFMDTVFTVHPEFLMFVSFRSHEDVSHGAEDSSSSSEADPHGTPQEHSG